MSFVAEFEIDSPILRASLRAAPGMVARTQDLTPPGDDPARYVFWATGDEFDAFESAMADDRTLRRFTRLSAVNDHVLYAVTLSDAGQAVMTYPVAAGNDVVFLEMRNDADATQVRALVPSRDALATYRAACEERDVAFTLTSLYREAQSVDSGFGYGLTEPQREALLTAYERGYFAEPREASLADVADELGVTRQSLASRLKRGHERLIASTLA